MVRKLFQLWLGTVVCVAAVPALPAFAQELKSPSLERVQKIEDMIVLVVDKSRLQADLRTWPERSSESSLLTSFRIAVGKEEGDKQKEGDNKTPEGIYFSQLILDSEVDALPAKYGPKAIPINFPNPFDRMDAKTGHGIWLHGVEKDQRVDEAKVTEGCVAFYNADIMTLTRWLRPHQAVIIISKDATGVNQESDLQAVRLATDAWVAAWRNRDVDGYINHYSPRFEHQGRNVKSYRRYKERVFSSYKDMEVGIEQLRVFTHQKYAVALMNQDFNGDGRYVSKGRKILYWEKDEQGQWKIAREVYEDRRIEFVSFSNAEIAQLTQNSPSAKVLNNSSSSPSNL